MERTLPGLLARARQHHGERLALTHRDDAVSFAELASVVARAADSLREHGVRPGDRVGVHLRPSLHQPVAVLAASVVGAVVVPLHPHLVHTNISHVVVDAGMSHLVVDAPRGADVAAGFAGRCQVLAPAAELGGPFVAQGPHIPVEPVVTLDEVGDDLAMLIYSSGSTGRPKGIKITHENLVLGAELVSRYLGTTPQDRIAGLLSLNFDYGLNQLWQALLIGASLHIHDFMLPRGAFQMLADRKITALPLMPALVARLFAPRSGALPDVDLSSVRYMCSSGGRLSDWARARLAETFPSADLVLMYGLTEAFRSSYLPAADLAAKPESIGVAIPEVSLHVVDENGVECARGEVGVLVHRGGCISQGYWNNPEATSRLLRELPAFPGEKVVWTGDLATQDDDGYFFVHGRADSQLKRDGFRISPQDVEEILETHPAVAESVVCGVPDGDRGDLLLAAWTARDGFGPDDGPDPQWLARHLAPHMVPGRLRHLAEFPVTANQGKVDRIAVTALLTNEQKEMAHHVA